MKEECRRVGERDVKREKGRKYLKHKTHFTVAGTEDRRRGPVSRS